MSYNQVIEMSSKSSIRYTLYDTFDNPQELILRCTNAIILSRVLVDGKDIDMEMENDISPYSARTTYRINLRGNEGKHHLQVIISNPNRRRVKVIANVIG